MTDKLITIAGIADRLAAVTGKPASFHARQTRGFVRSGALVPRAYAGEGTTAAAVFDETGLCRAMILHTLASLTLDFSILEITNRITPEAAISPTRNLDPSARIPNKPEPSDPIAFAIERISAGEKSYLCLSFPVEPFDSVMGGLVGWVSQSPTLPELEKMSIEYRGHIVLPLHTILRPLLS